MSSTVKQIVAPSTPTVEECLQWLKRHRFSSKHKDRMNARMLAYIASENEFVNQIEQMLIVGVECANQLKRTDKAIFKSSIHSNPQAQYDEMTRENVPNKVAIDRAAAAGMLKDDY